jgi:hypothetical protein
VTQKDSEFLTCQYVGLDRQPDYAYQGVTAKVAIPGLPLCQLLEWRENNRSVSLGRYLPTSSRRNESYVMKHRGCNKQVGDRVSDEPGLNSRAPLVRKRYAYCFT